MRLFHVSEEGGIAVFHPRIPVRDDIDKTRGLVWSINERCLPNFLTPRDCPRVTYHASETTTADDIELHFSSASRHVVVIESAWFERMKKAVLYLYEFDPSGFELQDEVAGYYVSTDAQIPIGKTVVTDVFVELFSRNIELRVVDNLHPICRKIQRSSLNWSMCRMRNAKPE
jgi:hypothetical protein